MKKINNKIVFSFLLGVIVTGTITVTALSITSKEVTYSPSNPDFNVNNADDALNYLYKLTDYAVPPDTYFYDKSTEGATIKRYKKVNGQYFQCNENGTILGEEKPVQVDTTKLIEYKAENSNNITKGTAGYANKNFLLGNGLDNLNIAKENYNKGFTDGKASANPGNAKITYNYHKHTAACSCGGHGYVSGYGHTNWDCNWIGVYCDRCGERFDYAVKNDDGSWVSDGWWRLLDMTDEEAYNNYSCYRTICGKNSNTIESATIVYE